MIEVVLLALALAMDAFAVSIGLGANQANLRQSYQETWSVPSSIPSLINIQTLKIGLLAGLYFGVAQGVMPLLGHLVGQAVLSRVADFAPYVGGVILIGLGGKMLFEAFKSNVDDAKTNRIEHRNSNDTTHTSHKLMLSLAIATSIDAMGAGFTLSLLELSPVLACLLIALITAVLSGFGVYIGKAFGEKLESIAEVFGGIVLMGIGINMMV